MTKYECHTHTQPSTVYTCKKMSIYNNKRQTKANIVEEGRRERTPVKRRRRRRSKGKHRTHTLECRTVDTELEKRELTEAFALIGGSIDKDFGADYVAEG